MEYFKIITFTCVAEVSVSGLYYAIASLATCWDAFGRNVRGEFAVRYDGLRDVNRNTYHKWDEIKLPIRF